MDLTSRVPVTFGSKVVNKTQLLASGELSCPLHKMAQRGPWDNHIAGQVQLSGKPCFSLRNKFVSNPILL